MRSSLSPAQLSSCMTSSLFQSRQPPNAQAGTDWSARKQVREVKRALEEAEARLADSEKNRRLNAEAATKAREELHKIQQ
eukprot:810439-Rhodomonas_salina.1